MGVGRGVLYLCGNLGVMTLVRFFFSWNLKFADRRGVGPNGGEQVLLDASLVGLAFFLGRIFDGVTDPIAGILGDRWTAAGRQRRHLLWFAIALPPVSLVLLFAPAHSWTVAARWAAFLGGMAIFFTGYTFYAIPYWSLVDDYSAGHQRRREALSTLLGTGLMLATAVVGVISPLLIGRFGYLGAAMASAVVGGVLMVLPIFAQPPDARPVAALLGESLADRATLRRQLVEALRNRKLLAVFCIFSASQMAFTVVTFAAPFIAEALLGGSERDVAKLMAPFLATSLPFFAVTPRLVARLGWQKAVEIASLGLALVYAGTAALGSGLVGSPMTTAMLVFALGGPMAAVILALENAAVVECAAEVPGNRTSVYLGLFNFVIKAANGLATFLTGLLVSLSQRPGWRRPAVRAMGITAGGLLVLGVAAYYAIQPRRDRAASETPE